MIPVTRASLPAVSTLLDRFWSRFERLPIPESTYAALDFRHLDTAIRASGLVPDPLPASLGRSIAPTQLDSAALQREIDILLHPLTARRR